MADLRTDIASLEAAWSEPDGFLAQLREGIFNSGQAGEFLQRLRAIDLPKNGSIDRRLVALLWYIPLFVGWQRERIANHGGDPTTCDRFCAQITAVLKDILGVP